MYYFRSTVRHSGTIADAGIPDTCLRDHRQAVHPVWQPLLIITFLLLFVPGSALPAPPAEDTGTDPLALKDAVALAIGGNPGLAGM